MTQFVQGIKSLFSGPDTSAQKAATDQAKQDQLIALDRQRQIEQQQAAQADSQLTGRTPRGRRLLLASTGDSGVQSTLGPNG